jgi:hypothetical protein
MAKSGLSILDPLEMWREALAQWEGSANKVAGKQLGSEEFAKALHTVTGTSLSVQQALAKANKVVLKEMNLASRADLVEIGERLHRIEDMLEHLIRQVGAPPVAARLPQAMPPRTRKPPTAAAAVPVAAIPVAVAPPEPAAKAASRAARKSATRAAPSRKSPARKKV